jgi:hypothetical protein
MVSACKSRKKNEDENEKEKLKWENEKILVSSHNIA